MFAKIVSLMNTDISNLGKKNVEKKEVSDSSIEIHNQALSQTRFLGSIIQNLDTGFFTSSDFIFYLDLKSSLVNNKHEYQGLNKSAELFRLAVKAQSNFLKIEQTELRYRSRKQQEFYDFIFDLLTKKFNEDNDNHLELGMANAKRKEEKYYCPDEFKKLIRGKLVEVQEKIKTEEGKQALEDYAASLEELTSEKNLGLKLLYLFKKSATVDFSVLRTISEMVTYLQDKNVTKMKAMEDLVLKNQEIFMQVGRIVGVPRNRENTTTYAILLQYMALSSKYESLVDQFIKMIACLKDWQISYRQVSELRSKYPENQYKIPEEFKREITALDMFLKYQKYLELY